LIEQYKDRPDVLFLSLNMDDNPGSIQPFLTERKLSLTVLPAYSYVTETLKVLGIPQNWIVGTDGVIHLKGVGYDSTEKWEQGMRDAIEKCKAQSPTPPTAVASPSSPPLWCAKIPSSCVWRIVTRADFTAHCRSRVNSVSLSERTWQQGNDRIGQARCDWETAIPWNSAEVDRNTATRASL
jgi:hypothetical protein